MTIVVISEFAGSTFDGVVSSVFAELARRYPSSRVLFVAGFLKRYRYGGLRLSRLANYAAVYAKSLACYLRYRPDVVLVDTTPPLIQLWAAFLGRIFKAKVYVWLMDYHPEIEARYCEAVPGFRWFSRVLRKLDASLLATVSGVATLDEAMADIVRVRCPSVEVKVHPVWSKQGTGHYEPITLNHDESELRLAYVGNLGSAHGLADVETLLAGLQSRRVVKLMIVGGNAAGLGRWKEMAHRLGAEVRHADRLPWNALRERLNDFRPDYGVVLMDEDKRGLLSPSKYATYVQLGLPILYAGPRRTNADMACRVTGAGFAVSHDEILQDLAAVLQGVLQAASQPTRQTATRVAYDSLSRLNEFSFVELLQPWLSAVPGADGL